MQSIDVEAIPNLGILIRRTILTLMLPLNLSVWISLILSLLVIPFAFFATARVEERVLTAAGGIDLSNWSNLGNAGFYSLGTLLGESVRRMECSSKAWAIRCD